MNEEVNDFLKINLEEAHSIFKGIISEMKDNNVDVDYYELETEEMSCYQNVTNIMNKMDYYIAKVRDLEEDKNEILDVEYKLYLKYFSLYVVSLVFIKVFCEIVDTSKLNELVKYFVGMFLGSTYMGLLYKDINDNRTDTKDKRDLINKLKTIREEYKKNHDRVVCEIDGIFALNDTLWDKLDYEKVKKMSKY